MKWFCILILPSLLLPKVLGSCSSLLLTQDACPLEANPLSKFEAAVERQVAGQQVAIRTISKAFAHNMRDYEKWKGSKFSFQSVSSLLSGLPHSIQHVLVEKEVLRNRTFAQFFHFSGPTGVGKSLVARILSRCLFAATKGEEGRTKGEEGSVCGVLEINMRSLSGLKPWQMSGAMANITGRIRSQLHTCPRSAVILDEIQSISYQQLDSMLGQVDLHPPGIFILVSDLGARKLNASMSRDEATSVIREAALVSTYGTSPMLHRIILHNMVPFLPLDEDELRRVADIELQKLEANFIREYDMWKGKLTWGRAVSAHIARECILNEVYLDDGGRGVETFVHHELAFMVEVKLSELLESPARCYNNVDVRVEHGAIRVEVDSVYDKGDFDES
ncbi:hypothetical protein GUITHDRAFT_102040 [Guillardia theta CCMP2712]|uniref:AAA+ ATPase domain-containing protein n=1 Tax=Guillardia theta (strain CCMP2712) TaxID=905079 RepID=L1JUY8_GUITC|nr:hypothetical protein GUITHDRAFT_102040 [Guillardia theta CCMP2712]EKX52139.1 hypothetical protein GUITHDRAFT_102040 [Guillardia theta CCMP2712]|eukprot:XP_005839119.1 hypothetical protein GUITHDRAFT_102040 [Guillardia theta CCMP2712]